MAHTVLVTFRTELANVIDVKTGNPIVDFLDVFNALLTAGGIHPALSSEDNIQTWAHNFILARAPLIDRLRRLEPIRGPDLAEEEGFKSISSVRGFDLANMALHHVAEKLSHPLGTTRHPAVCLLRELNEAIVVYKIPPRSRVHETGVRCWAQSFLASQARLVDAIASANPVSDPISKTDFYNAPNRGPAHRQKKDGRPGTLSSREPTPG